MEIFEVARRFDLNLDRMILDDAMIYVTVNNADIQNVPPKDPEQKRFTADAGLRVQKSSEQRPRVNGSATLNLFVHCFFFTVLTKTCLPLPGVSQ